MTELDDVVKEFLVESHENLDRLDADLVELEQNPDSRPLLASIFRVIHTIKGTCGFLGFSKLESLTHAGENLLSKLRDGVLRLDESMASALLKLVDGVREILACLEEDSCEGSTDYSELTEVLLSLSEGRSVSASVSAPESADKSSVDAEAVTAAGGIGAEQGSVEAFSAQSPMTPHGSQGTDSASLETPAPGCSPEQSAEGEASPGGIGGPAGGAGAKASRGGDGGGQKPMADNSIRVDVGLLDKLMNLVGELVLARNQTLQFATNQEDAAFLATVQRLNLITTELQEGLMKTRMQPIGRIWGKFPRIVRDLAQICGKHVSIEMEGAETELDRTLIEAIKDPMTHIVRNSVDHGIEKPDVRIARGKDPEGRLFLRAFHEGGQVNIEISDDGGGIDPQRIRSKALRRGLITSDAAERMSERELLNLIFLPGFSTAEQVTNVSGRGVGMDVVKTNIERIGGTVDIQSEPGHRTTLRIKIPLTLAIIPALVVTSAGERFCIPQVNLLELVRLEGESARSRVEHIHGVPVYRLRGNLLPLVYLNEQLQMVPADLNSGDKPVNIVVLQALERSFGLVVDEINDTEEIVVKPLGKQLKGLSVFAGATIMGDGCVALILDVMGIAQRSGVVNEVRERARSASEGAGDGAGKKVTLLLFATRDESRMVMPLSTVARLEEFAKSQLEWVGNQAVVQYRGEILPLVELSSVIPDRRRTGRDHEDTGTVQVVVYSDGGRSVGIIVDRIIDIVEEVLVVKQQGSREGVVGVTVIQGLVTEIVDVEAIIRRGYPAFFKFSAPATAGYAMA